MHTIITRVGFCERCSRNSNPRSGLFYVVHGDTGWHVYKSTSLGKIGFVPTNYKLIKVIGQNVVYEKLCSIHNCGVYVYYDNIKQNYQFDQLNWQRGMLSITTWNALQQYKHDKDYYLF